MRVVLLACSPIARDTRVLKTAASLQQAGHDVCAVGYGPAPDTEPVLPLTAITEPQPTTQQRLLTVAVRAPANLSPRLALPLWRQTATHRALVRAGLTLKPDILHANDWMTLPAALEIKRATGCKVVYDSHEFAAAEHEERLYWRMVSQRFVRAIEGCAIAHADTVITVSASIADALQAAYGLPARPCVVANTPRYEAHSFCPVGARLEVLFHGLMKPGRGLELLIDAIALVRRPIRLTIRGFGARGYVERLKQRAATADDRVQFVAAVAPADVVRAAVGADIGVFVADGASRQNDFALPNKVFDYMMAGAGVLVGPGRDLSALIAETGAGFVTRAQTPPEFAAALDALSIAEIETAKQLALIAARQYAWEAQEQVLTALYRSLARGGSAP
jgi:glycogen synthase